MKIKKYISCLKFQTAQRDYCTMKDKKIDSVLIALCLVIGFGLYNKEALENFAHSLPSIEVSSAPNVGISKLGQLHYFGEINDEGYELLRKLYTDYKKKITNKTLIMGSRGGDIFAALKIGNFIKDKKLSIKVPSLCLSVCAHYIFPAANFKYLGKNALIGFHEPIFSGTKLSLEDILTNINSKKLKIDSHDLIQTDTRQLPAECILPPELATTPAKNEKMLQDTIQSCAKYFNRQTRFFYKKLHVDSRLIEVGIPKLRQAITQDNSEIHSYYYDSESLKALGVEQVIYPYDWAPQNNPEYKNMIEIKLSDWH